MRFGADTSDWPNADLSREVFCPPHRWHVQESGEGDTLLLLHGAGGSTHSFRDLIPILAKSHHVVALDLPGQGFTRLGARHRCGLEEMTQDIASLCAQQGWHPGAIIGHSAGAAIALNLSQYLLSPRGQSPRVIGINAALDNFKGLAGLLFPAIAKVLASVPFTASLFSSASATKRRIAALIRGTGSHLDDHGIELYRRLVADRDHVDATLMMMAHWSLDDLLAQLPRITAPTLFIVGDKDSAVPPDVSRRAATKMPAARVISLPGLGHLAHEEAPDAVAKEILEFLKLRSGD